MLAFSSDIEGVKFVLRALNGSDDLSIVLLPIGDLPIGASSQYLVLFGVEDGLLEGSGLEQAEDASPAFKVPDDAGTVTTGRYCLRVIFTYLD